jgi:sodium transport system permease protein
VRAANVQTVFRKEIKDTLRDRRTLIFMLAVPVLAIPLLMTGMSSITIRQISKQMKETSVVVVEGRDALPSDLERDLASRPGVRLREAGDIGGGAPDSLRASLQAGKVDALVRVPQGFAGSLEEGKPAEVEILYDGAEMRSEFALAKVESVFSAYRDGVIEARLRERGVPSELLRPFSTVPRDVAPMQKTAARVLGPLLPYLIILMCFLGSMYPAIDLAAGEKERGTLETLLVAPAERIEFVLGKYLVILTTGSVAALLSMASLTFSLNRLVGGALQNVGETLTLNLTPSTAALILMTVLPMAGVFAAVMLSVSVFARSFKEAQSYLTVMNFLIIFPAFVSFVPGLKTSLPLSLIPVVNVSLIIRDAVSGSVSWPCVAAGFASMLLLAAATLFFAARWFERESVIFRE